jgi:hypothetical protein
MVPLSKITASLVTVVQLLPVKRHRHVWDDVHCDPPACTVCGRRGFPRDPFDVFGD